MGSIAVARRTGSALAPNAASAISEAAPAMVGQSVGCTPNSWLPIRLPNSHTDGRAITTPQPSITIVSQRISQTADARVAPCCNADANLARPIRHDEGHDTINPYDREQDRQAGKRGREHCQQPLVREQPIELIVDGDYPRDWQRWIHGAHDAADGRKRGSGVYSLRIQKPPPPIDVSNIGKNA